MTLGKHWSSDAPALPVEVEVDAESGWSFVGATVPYDCGGVSVWAPVLDKWLPYDITAPSVTEQARWALQRLYTNAWTERVQAGEMRWLRDLLDIQKGARFEVALVNALTRLGIPRPLRRRDRARGPVGGPAAPGVDLIALDFQFRRATLISLKAATHSPTEREIGKLLEGVHGLSAQLPGWNIIGVLACRAPVHPNSSALPRGPICACGVAKTWRRLTGQRDRRPLPNLRLPSGWPVEESWRYFLGYTSPFER